MMRNIFLCACSVWFFSTGMAWGIDNVVLGSGGGSYAIKTSTLKDYRFRDTIVQQRDFSCGSAALATMMRYHYGYDMTEVDALQAMYEVGDKKKIETEGFSLFDMKNYLASIGIQAEGYRVSIDKLAKVGIPAIALVNLKGYLHFVLVRGIHNDKVLIADPAQGMKTLAREDFEKVWNKVFFVITSNKPTGRKHFNLAKHWGRSLNDHQLHQVSSQNDLASLTLHTARTPGYY